MRIEQAIHGYSDGHRLLAASTDLSREARHATHGLSDLSGQYVVEGFEEYLTGYPVPGSNFFAFAKTWYAGEMERPGCVWTHTLLVANSDLGALRQPAALASLFRRPTNSHSWSAYEAAVNFFPMEISSGPPAASTEVAFALIAALYGTPEVSVLLLAEDAREYELLALEAWTQQWPSLRASFRFCTGAIASRAITGKSFDLQIVPVKAARELRRELPTASVISPPWPKGSGRVPEWVSTASADLLRSDGGRFRAFLHRAALDLPSGRGWFASLAELYVFAGNASANTRRLPDLFEYVSSRYPTVAEARGLKRALFGGQIPLAMDLIPGTSEGDILRAAATSRLGESFDASDLDLDARARALWTADRAEGLRLVECLARNDANALGERLLVALAQSVSPDDAAKLVDTAPALAATVVRLSPQAAVSSELWRGPDDRQRTLFDAATAGQDTRAELRHGIVWAMLRAGSDAVTEAVGRRFGPDAVFAALDWFDASAGPSPEHLPPRWRSVIGSNAGSAVDWLAGQEQPRWASAALVASVTFPHSPDVLRRGPAPWLKPLRNRWEVDRGAELRLRAFLLALGFDNSGPGSDELVAVSFAIVHDALAKDRLGYEQWSWLEDQVPTLSRLRNWDRCERLRRGLAERFARYGWQAAQYVRCAADEDVLLSMLESCRKAEGGKALLRRLDEALSSGSLGIDSECRKVLKRYV